MRALLEGREAGQQGLINEAVTGSWRSLQTAAYRQHQTLWALPAEASHLWGGSFRHEVRNRVLIFPQESCLLQTRGFWQSPRTLRAATPQPPSQVDLSTLNGRRASQPLPTQLEVGLVQADWTESTFQNCHCGTGNSQITSHNCSPPDNGLVQCATQTG